MTLTRIRTRECVHPTSQGGVFMKQAGIVTAMVATALLGGAALSAPSTDTERRVGTSREAIQVFAATLKGELQAAMEAGGPSNAIDVCTDRAPAIAASVSEAQGMSIARTSLRYRNPDNSPDPWESKVLEEFEMRRAAGEDPMTMDFAETLETAEGPMFRYMKAIPTAELCLKCHGTDLDPKVSAQLDALYPDDRARGFNKGDIRGAFSVSQIVE